MDTIDTVPVNIMDLPGLSENYMEIISSDDESVKGTEIREVDDATLHYSPHQPFLDSPRDDEMPADALNVLEPTAADKAPPESSSATNHASATCPENEAVQLASQSPLTDCATASGAEKRAENHRDSELPNAHDGSACEPPEKFDVLNFQATGWRQIP